MCNLYSITANQDAIRRLFRVTQDSAGNLAPMPGVFPDYPAPVVGNAGTERELTMMRWGMPPPPKFGGPPVTNIRNTSSPHWRGLLKTGPAPTIRGAGIFFRNMVVGLWGPPALNGQFLNSIEIGLVSYTVG